MFSNPNYVQISKFVKSIINDRVAMTCSKTLLLFIKGASQLVNRGLEFQTLANDGRMQQDFPQAFDNKQFWLNFD